jgi:surfactin synthase thioesterase subunit
VTSSTVLFSHGKDSGPWGRKITALAARLRELGVNVDSIDYRGVDEPDRRVQMLEAAGAGAARPLILVGSSLGGHVAAAAAARLQPAGLFLMAPAFYMQGYEQYTPQQVTCPVCIVHGWHDDIVSVENSIRWGREHRAALHVLDSDHRLEDQIPVLCELLEQFLAQLGALRH